MVGRRLQAFLVLIIVIIIAGIAFAQDNNCIGTGYSEDSNCFGPNANRICTTEYKPVCGEVQIQCITTPCDPLKKTFSNMCELDKTSAKFLYEGECIVSLPQGCPIYSSPYCPNGEILSTYDDNNCPIPYCQNTTTEKMCGGMVYSKAKAIVNSVCGQITGNYSCNEGTGTWWFDLAQKKAGCSPACVVDVNSGKAEINWRCTGLIEPDDKPIACTMEYAPVCAQVKTIVCPTPTCSDNNCSSGGVCTTELAKKTFSNRCVAKASGAEFLYEGECGSPVEQPCACTKEYVPVCGEFKAQEYEKTFSNACEAKCAGADYYSEGECGNCPQYEKPYCPSGQIVSSRDDKGCEKPICKENKPSEFFKYAKWACSNGEVFREGSESSCKAYAYWKEIARQKCASLSTKCITPTTTTTQSATSTTSGGANSATNPVNAVGNFLLEIVAPQSASTVATTSSIQNTEGQTKCIGGEVYITAFDAQGPCSNDCNSYIDADGCKVIACGNENAKRYCPQTCVSQPYEEIKIMKDACYAKGGEVRVETNDSGCTEYKCVKKEDTECQLIDDIPKEKYANCEDNGGKILAKTNEQGCLVYFECVGKAQDTNAKINKEILNDTTKLLELALKLETLKLELNKTADKTQALADYYTSKGDTNTAAKFVKATELLQQGVSKIDAVKALIKNNVSNFTEENAIEVRTAVSEIREKILNEVLMVLLE